MIREMIENGATVSSIARDMGIDKEDRQEVCAER